MPAMTRAVRAPRAPKENIDILSKTKAKNVGNGTKAVRKPLADKTNSASDENASPESIKKVIKNNNPSQKNVPVVCNDNRPRRNRRLPPRYVENFVLSNLSNSKENATTPNKSPHKTPVKGTANVDSPFKTPTTGLDNSLLANRPKRVSRVPSKFDENSVSPTKFAPTHCHTSTPLVTKAQDKLKGVKKTLGSRQATQASSENGVSSQKIIKVTPQKASPRKNTVIVITPQKVSPRKVAVKKFTPQKVTPRKVSPQKVTQKKVTSQNDIPNKITPQKANVTKKKLVQNKLSEVVKNIDTNNTRRQERVRRLRKPVEYKEDTLSPKLKSPEKKTTNSEGTKVLKANSSYRVLEDKKSKSSDKQDIYEFTFDPTEEPLPQKKKKKKATVKKPTKPKTRVYNNNYEKNIARALADLKKAVTKHKPEGDEVSKTSKPTNNPVQPASNKVTASAPTSSSIVISTVAEIHPDPAQKASIRSNLSTKNRLSYQVEDIAADFDASMDHHEINYSPVNSPHRIETEPEICPPTPERAKPDDPLNLRNDLSFFDDQPVASSSINASKNPMATPWRVEFENLPIKWQADTYVKPDMTPALECSFINNFDDSKKKHVYTNIIAETNDALPEVESEAPKLKQTSIISFIKEVVERSASKKKKRSSVTPTKANSLFDMSNVTTSVTTPRKETSGTSNNSAENESSESNKPQKRKSNEDNNPTPAKLPCKDKENTLFGFDDSDNQENLSPVKVVSNRLRNLRSRSGAVLKELNKQSGPMRAELPAAMRAKLAPSSDAVEMIYDQMKSAADAPVLLDKQGDAQVTNIAGIADEMDDDSQSVHLFEDIELVHHLKPTRKSYGKANKVTFQNPSDSAESAAVRNQSSDDDDDNLEDLSFHLPEVKTRKVAKKKKTKKQMLSKKEKAEVDAWAASFNSMCEDVEEFDLVFE